MLGTVTSVEETYSVCPIWLNAYCLTDVSSAPVPLDEFKDSSSHICTFDCPQPMLNDIELPLTQCLIHNIPGEELRRAEDLLEADYVIVRPADDANNGEIVVALIGEEATVKRYYREPDHVRLQPENDEMDPIITTEAQVLGKVVGVFRAV